MPEWSKGPVSSSGVFVRVGSNPTSCIYFFNFKNDIILIKLYHYKTFISSLIKQFLNSGFLELCDSITGLTIVHLVFLSKNPNLV